MKVEPTDLDIYRSAMVFIKKYGDKAKSEAILTSIER